MRDLIVIGGGPAGSTVAALTARAGLDVLLLEADRHPRVHVGESLLPGIIPILAEMDALEAVETAGFGLKSGTTHWQWGRTPEWDLWFSDTDSYDHAWLVDRARFDEILFRAAERAGAEVLEHAAVKDLHWEGDRLVGVSYRRRGESTLREERARITVDATGQAGLIARKLGLRNVIEGLKHQASWAHFDEAGRLPPPRENQALFVAEKGHWLWLFPFQDGRASVGVVRLDDGEPAADADRSEAFDRIVAASEAFSRVLGPGARRSSPVRTERDWSYRMSRVAGPGWLLAGDASGFIDPVLSTGVFLAMHAGHQVAHVARAVSSGAEPEERALARYQSQHAELFGDLLRMVRFYYQQNLYVEDYFWESKRILMRPDTELKPQKAFLILTSGLVKNLALAAKQDEVLARREAAASRAGELRLDSTPEQLGFVCIHLRWNHPPRTGETPAQLYFLIEPRDLAAPTLFRTRSWDVNCLAPRFGNDPIRIPELTTHLRALEARIRAVDTVHGEPLADFWRRTAAELLGALRRLPAEFEVVRVFGE